MVKIRTMQNERARKDMVSAGVFLLPNFFGILAFVVFPVVFSLVMAMTNWDLTNREPFRFVGLDNFKNLLWGENARYFWKYFLNTAYLLMGIPLSIAGSLFFAVLLNEPVRFGKTCWARYAAGLVCLSVGILGTMMLWSMGKRDAAFGVFLLSVTASMGCWVGVVFFRTLFYLPQLTSGVAMYILWRNLFSPEWGLVNRLLEAAAKGMGVLGLGQWSPPAWLASVQNLWGMNPETTLPTWRFFGLGARDALIFMGVWTSIGGANMLLYLAGLSNISKELYEVAEIDGAGRWSKFRYITWPSLAPITFFIVIIKRAIENLNNASQEIGKRMYEQAGKQAPPAGAATGGEAAPGAEQPKKGKGGDDVIDAEYEVK